MLKDMQNLSVRLNNIEFCFDTLLKLNKNEDKFAKKRVKDETERRSKELDKERAKEHKRDK